MSVRADEVTPGMVLPTLGGRGQVADVIGSTRRGAARLTIVFDNGIVAANVRPWDTFTLPERSKP